MKKRAILFGMFHYNNSDSVSAPNLPSTEYDVKSLEKKLKQLQFVTNAYMDLHLNNLRHKIQVFANNAPCDSLNIIYFSGHGGHSRGENYLYPIDFGTNLDSGLSIEQSALSIKILPELFSKKIKLIIIVDACRDNLTPSYSQNYSEMVASQDTYIAYSTQFGNYSVCTSQVSYFTETLCENILEPNISIDQLFTNVRAALYLKYSKQISNSVNGLMSFVTLNEQSEKDNVGRTVVQFVDKYGDMYVDKYGCFAGDDLIFIDAAQYCNISVLDAIYKYKKIDAERCHVTSSLSESHEKLIAFWEMLKHGLKQDEFYTWQYRGRQIRLGEIPPLPLDMQKPMPDEKKEIDVDFKIVIIDDHIEVQTNLPDNFQFYGRINDSIPFSNVVVKNGLGIIPLSGDIIEVKTLEICSVLATVSGVDLSIVGDRCRNLVGKHVKFDPIFGNSIKYHYKAN